MKTAVTSLLKLANLFLMRIFKLAPSPASNYMMELTGPQQ